MLKLERNEPCPCGSGKKYKKCCYVDPEKYQKMVRALQKAGKKEDMINFLTETITVYVFKVWLEAIEIRQKNFEWNENGIWRTIEIRGDQTLYNLHGKIQRAFNWDNDHLFSFYLSNEKWDKSSEYVGSPIGKQEPGVSLRALKQAVDFEIRDLNLNEGQKIKYVFDYGDEIIHELTLIKINKNPDLDISYPRVTETNGEVPLQYG